MCLTDRAGAILRQHTRSSSQGHHSQGALSAEGNGGGGEGQDEPGSAPYLFSARSLRRTKPPTELQKPTKRQLFRNKEQTATGKLYIHSVLACNS